jgi:hypothetical protein
MLRGFLCDLNKWLPPRFDIPRDCKPHGNLDTIFDLQVMLLGLYDGTRQSEQEHVR